MTHSHHGSLGAWPEAKLERATVHFQDLKGRVDAWVASDPYRLEGVIAEDRLSWRLLLRLDNPPPTVSWATILGDCLHNLRSALDAAVWELCRVGGATPDNPKSVQFPFTESPSDWRRRLQGPLAGLPADLLSRLEAVQPYNHRGDDRQISALTLLNALDVEDKHRAGIAAEFRPTAASNRSQIQFATSDAAERHVRPIQRIALQLTDGAVLHEETTLDPILDVRSDFDATVVFTIDTPRGPAPIWRILDLSFRAVITTLDHLYAVG